MSGAKAYIFDAIPTEPGPPSAIRYWVRVEFGDQVLTFEQVPSLDRTFSDNVDCMHAPIGSTHPAYVSPAGVSIWITPIPATIECSEIPGELALPPEGNSA